MSYIICGLPKNDEGLFYCPFCGFSSDNIEEFATTMCWNCIFDYTDKEKQEEIMGTTFDTKNLKSGQKVKISRECVVSAVDHGDKTFKTKDNRTVRFGRGYSWDSKIPVFTVELVEDAETVKHWPVQSGDVWSAGETKYMVLQAGSYPYIYKAGTTSAVNAAELKNLNPVLVYRISGLPK